jgi:hypothetical protein
MGVEFLGKDEIEFLKQPISDEIRKSMIHKLTQFEQECLRLNLPMSAKAIHKLIPKISTFTWEDPGKYFPELNNRLVDEMESTIFFSIEKNRQPLLVDKNLFGSEVTEAFPSASVDIEEAGKCLAFERWTAAVYHLSRVAEIATVTICKRVGYASPKEGFGEALKYMDSNLEKARKDYKHANPLFKGDLEFLSTVTTQMHAVNDAWRRHVSHMDKKYTEEEAIRIWDTTRALMQQLASKLKEETNA